MDQRIHQDSTLPVASFIPPSALSTAESIVVDGANGVSRAPREHFPQASFALPLAVATLVAVLWARRKFQNKARWFIGAALALSSIPGWVHVLALRADAPVHRPVMTRAIESTLSDLQSRVPWPQPRVRLVREDDDVLFPLARYALPSRPASEADPAIELELWGGPLGQTCRQEGRRVLCGDSP